MTEDERLENLQAQVADLKEAEDKIRTVRQDLESEARRIIHSREMAEIERLEQVLPG